MQFLIIVSLVSALINFVALKPVAELNNDVETYEFTYRKERAAISEEDVQLKTTTKPSIIYISKDTPTEEPPTIDITDIPSDVAPQIGPQAIITLSGSGLGK